MISVFTFEQKQEEVSGFFTLSHKVSHSVPNFNWGLAKKKDLAQVLTHKILPQILYMYVHEQGLSANAANENTGQNIFYRLLYKFNDISSTQWE